MQKTAPGIAHMQRTVARARGDFWRGAVFCRKPAQRRKKALQRSKMLQSFVVLWQKSAVQLFNCRFYAGKGGFAAHHAGKVGAAAGGAAAKLAAKSSTAHASQKRLIRKYFYGDMEKFAKDEGMEIAANSRQPDFTEAVNAFIEKRMPVYNQK